MRPESSMVAGSLQRLCECECLLMGRVCVCVCVCVCVRGGGGVQALSSKTGGEESMVTSTNVTRLSRTPVFKGQPGVPNQKNKLKALSCSFCSKLDGGKAWERGYIFSVWKISLGSCKLPQSGFHTGGYCLSQVLNNNLVPDYNLRGSKFKIFLGGMPPEPSSRIILLPSCSLPQLKP